jgi:hypothetical protein
LDVQLEAVQRHLFGGTRKVVAEAVERSAFDLGELVPRTDDGVEVLGPERAAPHGVVDPGDCISNLAARRVGLLLARRCSPARVHRLVDTTVTTGWPQLRSAASEIDVENVYGASQTERRTARSLQPVEVQLSGVNSQKLRGQLSTELLDSI